MLKTVDELSPQDVSECRTRALNLLARREHSERELYLKLIARDFAEEVILQVIQQLVAKNFLSDLRFAELYVQQRARKGYGPLRIQQELQQRGVQVELIEQTLAAYHSEWVGNAQQAWQKYMRLHPQAEFTKQQKFLLYRGFSFEQIRAAIKN
ncbi:MAG: regulatory protein RecX [Gammaproteobacteria bacterium]